MLQNAETVPKKPKKPISQEVLGEAGRCPKTFWDIGFLNSFGTVSAFCNIGIGFICFFGTVSAFQHISLPGPCSGPGPRPIQACPRPKHAASLILCPDLANQMSDFTPIVDASAVRLHQWVNVGHPYPETHDLKQRSYSMLRILNTLFIHSASYSVCYYGSLHMYKNVSIWPFY